MKNLKFESREKPIKPKDVPYAYHCTKCYGGRVWYNWSKHQFICDDCDYFSTMLPKQYSCKCGNVYQSFTWFDPPDCPHCGKSNVD